VLSNAAYYAPNQDIINTDSSVIDVNI